MRPQYRTVRELIHRHLWTPAVVLGGGESLPEQLAGLPTRPTAVYLSANQHGALLTECDYLVAHDKVKDKLTPFGKPIVTRHRFADYRVLGNIVSDSGAEAAWVARLMGCCPIYVCGVDLYTRGTYHHDLEASSTGKRVSLDVHLNRWREFLRRYPGPYMFRGDPLKTAAAQWPYYVDGPIALERAHADVGGRWVNLLRETPVQGEQLGPGLFEVAAAEAERLLARGLATPARPPS